MKNAWKGALGSGNSLCKEGLELEHACSTCVAFSHQMLPAGPLWPHPLLGKGAAEVDEACPDPLGTVNLRGW